MKRIDQVTDILYGPINPRKNNYDIPPHPEESTPPPPLVASIIQKIVGWNDPGSILVDWDSQEQVGAYQVEWYTDSALTQLVDSPLFFLLYRPCASKRYFPPFNGQRYGDLS